MSKAPEQRRKKKPKRKSKILAKQAQYESSRQLENNITLTMVFPTDISLIMMFI